MALKIQENNSAVAYHVVDGAVTFPYAIDAQQAISTHPGEWSASPWSAEDAAEARKKLGLAEPEIRTRSGLLSTSTTGRSPKRRLASMRCARR
jgi:hypothetical protein